MALLNPCGFANSDTLGPDTIDVTPNSSGCIDVDDNLRPPTTQDMWVLGDLRGGDMFTHTARHDAEIVYRNLHRSGQQTTTDRVVAPAADMGDRRVGVDVELLAVSEARSTAEAPRAGRQRDAAEVPAPASATSPEAGATRAVRLSVSTRSDPAMSNMSE